MELQKKINETFEARFGGHGAVYASAGRINLIGEHTDYNGGFVFPGAIDKVIMAEIRANGSEKVRVFSIDIDDYAEFGLTEGDAPSQSWARYIFGVCREVLKRGGKVEGFDAVFAGNVPLGAGLSSSAALESCFAFAVNDMFNGNGIDKFELARIGQSTEHNYCGVNCGIMDQFASVFGKKDHLMRLDCRSMEYDLGIETLRDATMEMLEAVKSDITAEDFFRAKFVIEEKDRVLAVCDALVAGDYETVGKCMYATHDGLSKDYEVSCEELDFLNDIARECGVTGSRIMGGGFGGCTINLVKDELMADFIATAKARFNEKYGHEPKIYEVIISDGARKVAEADR